jgi:membrane protease YdiL (CAAX protease family)
MNGYYNNYDNVFFETPEERQEKIKKQRRLFSRVFLALAVYMVTTWLSLSGIYLALKHILNEAQYVNFANSALWAMVTNCAAQYLIAFPVFMLVLIGTKTAKGEKKEKLSGAEFFLLFTIGQLLMYAGSFIGNFVNNVIGNMIGRMPTDNLTDTVNSIPVWLTFICVVVLAPVFEELIFRKLIIDRLSVYGDKMAIIFSAVAFGLMHGNFYQFFYAALLGLLFGFVYTKTRNIGYTILMHTIVNFLGSIVALPVQKATVELYEILDAAAAGVPVNILALIVSGTVMFIYTSIQYGLIIGGIIALIQYVKRKKLTISQDKEIYLPDNEIAKYGVVNVGAILFIVFSLYTLVANILV